MKRFGQLLFLSVFMLLLLTTGKAQAITLFNLPTGEYNGKIFTTPVQVTNCWDIEFNNCTFKRGIYITGGGGSSLTDCTVVGPLTIVKSIDYSLRQVKVSGNVVLGGQNYSAYGLWIYPRGNLAIGGSVAFISMTNMEYGRVVVNGVHIYFDGITTRLPDNSWLPLFSGRGRDVVVSGFVTWGGYSLVGHVGPDWSFKNGYHHGMRMTLWPPYNYPWAYPIDPDGTFGPGM